MISADEIVCVKSRLTIKILIMVLMTEYLSA